jgi:hypothetical protein
MSRYTNTFSNLSACDVDLTVEIVCTVVSSEVPLPLSLEVELVLLPLSLEVELGLTSESLEIVT